METNVFQRHEIKFLLDSRQRAIVEQAFLGRMEPDAHGESTIRNIYYDTPDYRLIRSSLGKPIYKEKLRMRSYVRAQGTDAVFLELKKKYRGVVYKRRIELPLGQAEAAMEGLASLPDSQIGREIAYAVGFYQNLEPAVFLCYDRSAWFSTEDPTLRATFDRSIRFRTEEMSLRAGAYGRQLLLPGWSLLEIKTASAIPMWLVEALEVGEIRQASFSKYGEAYKTLTRERAGVICA